jgi:hypothetical protein
MRALGEDSSQDDDQRGDRRDRKEKQFLSAIFAISAFIRRH